MVKLPNLIFIQIKEWTLTLYCVELIFFCKYLIGLNTIKHECLKLINFIVFKDTYILKTEIFMLA